jgi:hypothetical protein
MERWRNKVSLAHFALKIPLGQLSRVVTRHVVVRYSGDRLWLEIEICNSLSVADGPKVWMQVPGLGG